MTETETAKTSESFCGEDGKLRMAGLGPEGFIRLSGDSDVVLLTRCEAYEYAHHILYLCELKSADDDGVQRLMGRVRMNYSEDHERMMYAIKRSCEEMGVDLERQVNERRARDAEKEPKND